MALLSNGFRDTLGAFKTFGATASNNAYPSSGVANFARTGAMRNLTAGQGITSGLVGLPSGNRHSSAWMLPQKAGALAARNSLTGSGAIGSDILAVKLAQAALTGSGDLAAIGGLIVQLVADLAGAGAISDADLKAFLQAVASIGGSGTVSAAQAAGLGALIAAITGAGTVSPTLTGTGELTADLVVTGTGLTTANVGQAVWAALAAANNASGTMGQKLNAAGSAGDPWVTELPGSYTGEQAGALLAAIQVLVDELHKLQGLDAAAPLVVTETARTAGTIEQTLATAAGTTTVTRTP